MELETQVNAITILKTLWEKVLETKITEDNPNFFAFGGHSLKAIELISQIAESFGIELTMKHILENPSLEEMAQFIQDQKPSFPEVSEHYHDNEGSFPLTPNQQHLWNLVSLFPHNPTHNISNAIRIRKKLNIDHVNKVINNILKNHDALRTRFIRTDKDIVQKFIDHEDLKLEFIPLLEEKILPTLSEEMNYLFNLENEDLVRIKFFQISEEDYIFFFMAHHIVWDGITNIVFFRIFLEEYETLKSTIPASGSSYRDYVFAQRQHFKTPRYAETLQFWKNKFETVTSVPSFDRDLEGNIHDYRSHVANFKIDHELLKEVKTYIIDKNISFYNLFFACYHFLLFQKNHSELQIIGTPVHGRTNLRFLKTLGYFINTLPFIHHLDGKKTIRENLDAIVRNLNESFQHQEVPFEHLLKKTNASQLLASNSLFQTLFVYLDVTKEMRIFDSDEFDLIKIDREASHCEIDFYLYKAEREIDLIIEYRQGLFREETIQDLFHSYIKIIKTVIQNDSVTLGELVSVQKKYDTKYLDLVDLNLPSLEVPLFLDIIFKNLQTLGPRLAVKGNDFSESYESLENKVEKISTYLTSIGVQSQEVVGVYLQRDENLVPTLLAILKMGAIYLPLDPTFPTERLGYMIDKAKCKVILTTSKLPTLSSKVSTYQIEEALKFSSSQKVNTSIAGSDSAYLLFTSGSTGNPKGVEVTHENISHFLASMKLRPGITANDHLLSVTTISFDISVLEIFLPLYAGASLYLASKTEAMDPASLKNIIQSEKISLMQATPVTWRMIMNLKDSSLPNVKVLCGGEPLDQKLADTLIENTKEVWNMYGPTETTVWSSVKRVEKDQRITVGKPILNTYFLILDEELNHLPVGSQGRLFIGGKGVTKGYFRDEELTRERFIKHPHKEEIIYDTGDLAFYNEEGEIVCLGRSDGQVKIRGHRIELTEIEEVLLRNEVIYEAACKVINDEIYAFVSFKIEKEQIENELIVYLRNKLPPYMIPKRIVSLRELPKTPNGKIDKKQLFIKGPFSPSHSSIQYNDEIQKIILEIWRKHLQTEDISTSESFFNLGGHSLIALDIFNSINSYFNINLDLSSVFDNYSIEKLSTLVQKKINTKNDSLKDFKHIVRIHECSPTAKNIFCFHGVGGNVLNYYPLAQALKDFNFFGVQSSGLNGKDRVYASLEKMVQAYANEIKLIQPKGPYLLAGGSMGGMIALAVASLLEQENESTEKVLMFDTFGPGLSTEEENSVYGTLYLDLVSRFINKLKHMFFLTKVFTYRLRKRTLPQAIRYRYIQHQNLKIMRRFAPHIYTRPVILIKAKTTAQGAYQDPLLGWGETLKGDIKIIEIDGHHESFIETQEFLIALKSVMNK